MDFGLFAPLFFLAFGFSILQLVGVIFGMVDLLRREDPDVVGDSRVLWALIILFIPLAWIAYFVAGRR